MFRFKRMCLVLVVALLSAGCVFDWGNGGRGDATLSGFVSVRPDGFPLAGAEIELSGPAWRKTTTSRDGAFSLSGLPEGRYTATLRTLHNTYTTATWVSGTETLNWRIEPPSFDRELFYQLSGLKNYYIDGSGGLTWDYGRLVRWEQRVIRIFMDVDGAPYEFNPAWPDLYWQEIRRWETTFRGRVEFRRVYSAGEADVVLIWHPRGFLGDNAGIARYLAFYENGALKLVQIEIDVGYGGQLDLWAHELAHGMGIGHVTDFGSVMYPRLEPGQRSTLSQVERDHVRLMYDIPSGQRLASGYVTMLAEQQEMGGESSGAGDPESDGGKTMSTLTDDPVTGYRGHVTSMDGVHYALDESEASDAFILR